MSIFRYKAVNETGKTLKGFVMLDDNQKKILSPEVFEGLFYYYLLVSEVARSIREFKESLPRDNLFVQEMFNPILIRLPELEKIRDHLLKMFEGTNDQAGGDKR